MYDKRTLLVIDMQNDFFDKSNFCVEEDKFELSEKIIKYYKNFDFSKMILTKDWHDKDHESFKLYGEHCVKGTNGSKLIDNFSKVKNKKIFKKGTDKNEDELSAFKKGFDSKLYKYLIKKNIKTLYICGGALDICVLKTANDAVNLGFDVNVIVPLCYRKNMFEEYNKNVNPKINNILKI